VHDLVDADSSEVTAHPDDITDPICERAMHFGIGDMHLDEK